MRLRSMSIDNLLEILMQLKFKKQFWVLMVGDSYLDPLPQSH
jgi:hypothetical protein